MRLLPFILILLAISGFSQNGNFQLGARSAAMGSSSVVLQDHWSLFNNVAGLAKIDRDHAFTSYRNRFGLKELQTIGAGLVHEFGKFGGGIGVYRFGDALFSEQRINLGVGHKLDRVSLGVSVDYLQYTISSVGSRGVVVLEFGGIAELTNELSFGAHIYNLSQSSLIKEDGVRIPTIMKAGMAYRPNPDLTLTVETEKDLDFDEIFKAGLEYRLIKGVFVRTGLRTAPFIGTFGFGFYPERFQIDYAFSSDTNLGSIHEVSFSYKFKK